MENLNIRAPKLLMAPEELEVKVAPGKAVRGTFALAGRDGENSADLSIRQIHG